MSTKSINLLLLLLFTFLQSIYCASSFNDFFNLEKIYRNLSVTGLDVNEQCAQDFTNYLKALQDFTEDPLDNAWAAQFFDASSKFLPDGFMRLSLFELGNFDECKAIHVTATKNEIYGKYCLGTIPVTSIFGPLVKELIQKSGEVVMHQRAAVNANADFKLRMGLSANPGFALAFCIPHTCSSEDLNKIFKNLLIEFDDSYCYTKLTDPDLSSDAAAIITIAILCFFLCLTLAETAFDVYLTYHNEKTNQKILTAFSLYSNGKSLLKTSSSPNQLNCLQGIRALSMAWVIVGHTYSNVSEAPLANALDVTLWMNKTSSMWIIGASVSVDSFFVIGGLVTVYSFMLACERGVPFNIPLYYVHRYLRLTPVYAVIMLMETTLPFYLGDGPLYSGMSDFTEPCKEHWWQNLLYIQNYFNDSEMCVPVSWYLSNDFQMFLFSPLVLYPLMKWPKVGLSILGVFIFGGFLSPFLISIVDGLPASDVVAAQLGVEEKFSNHYYSAPFARFGPYVIGMAVGYVIFLYKKKKIDIPKIPAKFVLCYWVVALAGLLACVYSNKEVQNSYDKIGDAFFLGLDTNMWAIGLSMVILACVTGYGGWFLQGTFAVLLCNLGIWSAGVHYYAEPNLHNEAPEVTGPINAALSLPIFQFLAKLSYCMYLIHFKLIWYGFLSLRSPYYFKELDIILYFFGIFVLSALIAIPFTLIFESPVIIIEKMIFGRDKPRVVEKSANKSPNETCNARTDPV